MKTALFIAVLCGLISCTGRSEDLRHVADMQLNDTLTRAQLVEMPEWREIFVSLPDETKSLLFKYKITQDILNEDLTSGEKAQLQALLDKVSPKIYSGRQMDRFNEFAAEWEKTMIKEYGWDEKKVYMYGVTVQTAEELRQYIKENDIEW